MSKKEKLIQRIMRLPRDFTYEETVALLTLLGFVEENKGKTSGSRVMFTKEGGYRFRMHKPHPQKEIKPAALKDLFNYLKTNNLI